MNSFEIRYNGIEHAKIVMLQRLLLEVAELQQGDKDDWIDRFRNACITEINETQNAPGTPRPAEVRQMATATVKMVSDMAKHRLAQRQGTEPS